MMGCLVHSDFLMRADRIKGIDDHTTLQARVEDALRGLEEER